MKKLFAAKGSPEEYSVIQWANYMADMILLSILWTVCALPLVTVGVASAALYHTAVKVLVEEKGSIFSTFVQSVKDSWKQALPIGAVLALISAALLFLAYSIVATETSGLWLVLTACIVLLLHLTLVQIHLYPLIGHFVLTRREIVSLVIRLTSSHFLRNAALLSLFLGAVVAALFYPPLVLFLLPGGYAVIAEKLQTPMFAKFIRTQQGDVPEPEQ